MYKRVTLLVFLSSFLSFSASSTQQKLPPKTTVNVTQEKGPAKAPKCTKANIQIIVPINNSNVNTLTNIIDIKSKIMAYIKMINSSKIMNNLQQNMKTCAVDLKRRTISLFGHIKGIFWGHKYKLIALTIIGAYCYLIFQFIAANKFLKRCDLWCSWKQHMNMESIITIPQKELSYELATNIQAHYVNATNPTDSMSPMARFIIDVEVELKKLKIYEWIYYWVEKFRLQNIFPFDEKNLALIKNKIRRLAYFKSTFSSWLADHKMSEMKQTVKKCLKLLKKKKSARLNIEKSTSKTGIFALTILKRLRVS